MKMDHLPIINTILLAGSLGLIAMLFQRCRDLHRWNAALAEEARNLRRQILKLRGTAGAVQPAPPQGPAPRRQKSGTENRTQA